MRIFLLLILTFLAHQTFSQEVVVHGRCINKKKQGVENISVRINQNEEILFTNKNGDFSFKASVGDSLNILYALAGDTLKKKQFFYVKNSNSNKLPAVEFNVSIIDIEVVEAIKQPFDIQKIEIKKWQELPIQQIEHVLIFTSVARSSNELTANYNVRGGNYDENLVYVNGFQIFRPFLTRAGQQEGMSFINSALVESLNFSGGGFDSQYGDKLSSVLDIKYRNPQKFKGSVMGSMLGVEGHLEQILGKKQRFSYMMGARYRSNGYFLNSLPTKGAYNPVFWDAQLLTEYVISENWKWSTIFHYSSNNYTFSPQTSETIFGPTNEAYSLMIYFDGQEKTQFRTLMGGTKFAYESRNKKTKLDFYASAFHSDEREYFDVQGQYFINQLETDPSKEEYGDSIAVLGVGTFLDHARNRLRATIFNVYHNGNYQIKNAFVNNARTKHNQFNLLWGVNFQQDDFQDVLSEWKMVDSAGYSLPQSNDHKVNLKEVIKGRLNLQATRASGHVQLNSIWSRTKLDYPVTKKFSYKDSNKVKYTVIVRDTIDNSASKWALSVGTRATYTSVNNEFFVTPRVSVIFNPRSYLVKDSSIERRNTTLRFSTGLYYQPPMYREMRTFTGELNTDVLAQKSYHAVLGYDMFFFMWGRDNPFKFTAELFYKYMWDVNPYRVDNVRTRYYANNNATAYAFGVDFNINGEFIEGISSYFKLGIMQTMEDIKGDSYTEYYNAAGNKIYFGYSTDQVVVDSAVISPGFIPRPTDQLLNIGVLIQDQMPKLEALSVQVGLQYGTPLPFGPPGYDRFKDTLRMKAYFRVDFGTSYDFLYKKRMLEEKGHSVKENFFNKTFTDAILSFEVYNLLGINNEMSRQWIQDVNGGYYAVPNYLTQRRFNLKFILRF